MGPCGRPAEDPRTRDCFCFLRPPSLPLLLKLRNHVETEAEDLLKQKLRSCLTLVEGSKTNQIRTLGFYTGSFYCGLVSALLRFYLFGTLKPPAGCSSERPLIIVGQLCRVHAGALLTLRSGGSSDPLVAKCQARAPTDHINIRISPSGSVAQYKRDTRNHVL